MSSGSSLGFLSTIAYFCEFGSVPDDSKTLNIWHSTGAGTTAAFLIIQVESGSRTQCFGGTFLSGAIISVVEVIQTRYCTRFDDVWNRRTRTVAVRILSTLTVKWVAKSTADDE